jgi:hypothetical protein
MNLRSLEAQAERLCCVTEYSGEASAVGYDQLRKKRGRNRSSACFQIRAEARLHGKSGKRDTTTTCNTISSYFGTDWVKIVVSCALAGEFLVVVSP